MADDEQPSQAPELTQVHRWRLVQARDHLGVPKLEAELFASSEGDLGLLRSLIEDGCDPTLAVRIAR